MTFEDDLRSRLHTQADDLAVHGRGATDVMRRGRQRQHRARRATAAAAAGVLTVGTVGVLSVRHGASDVTVDSASSAVGLTPAGPLELSWQTVDGAVSGGVTGAPRFTEDATGVLYALSTAPGAQYPTDGTALDPVLYRLAEDGTWQPTSTVGSGPRLTDLAAAGTVLYSLSTSPATSGAGYDTRLSSSPDGGQTWTDVSVLPVQPPSTAVAWQAHSSMQVETNELGAAIAVVTTGFVPPQALADQAAAAAGYSVDEVSLEVTDAGIDVVRDDRDGGPDSEDGTRAQKGSDGVAPEGAPITTVPAADPALDGDTAGTRPPRTTVRTYAWNELGVAGPAALRSTAQVLVRQADAWVPVDGAGLVGLAVDSVDVIGRDFVVQGWATSDDGTTTRARTMASTDGQTWRLVSERADGDNERLVGVGDTWVAAGDGDGSGAPPLAVSVDRGATWQGIDLGAVDGRLVGGRIIAVDGGPLGLAAVVVPNDGRDTGLLITTRDLVEWTVAPLSELSARFAGSRSAAPSIVVGADRIVLTSTTPEGHHQEGRVEPSVTLIGTPVR